MKNWREDDDDYEDDEGYDDDDYYDDDYKFQCNFYNFINLISF